MKTPPGTLTTLSDGRVVFTPERPNDLPRVIERELPGDLGAVLSECRFRARVVIDREDGAPLSAGDAASVDDMLAAAAETFARTDGMLRDLLFLRRTQPGAAQESTEARSACAPPARKPSRKRAAAKRPPGR